VAGQVQGKNGQEPKKGGGGGVQWSAAKRNGL